MDGLAIAQNGEDSVRVYQQSQRLAAVQKAKRDNASMAEVDKVAEEYEAVFLSEMLNHMFDQVDTNELFGGGEGEDMYKSLLVNEYGKLMARSGGIGVADYVKREMLKLQEVPNEAGSQIRDAAA